MAWVYLVVAGLLEVGWAIGLKYTEGFTRLVPSILTGSAIVLSMFLLSLAARTLPIGTAYGVWVGIGTVGTAVLGILLFDEPRNFGRVVFLALLVVSIVGLKLTTVPQPDASNVASEEVFTKELDAPEP
jgi:quaternary ammonium compound-resistance protein SugE